MRILSQVMCYVPPTASARWIPGHSAEAFRTVTEAGFGKSGTQPGYL